MGLFKCAVLHLALHCWCANTQHTVQYQMFVDVCVMFLFSLVCSLGTISYVLL